MFINNRLNRLAIIGTGTILVLAGSNCPTLAQSRYDNEGYQSNEKSGIFGDAPSGLDPLEIMHRAQQLNNRSAAEFNADSQGQLDDSVSDFKRLQQQRILEQQQQIEINPVEAPAKE